MNHRFGMRIFIVLIVVILGGCSYTDAGVYEYHPVDEVTLIVQTKGLKKYPNIESVFLFIELTVLNQSKSAMYFDIGKLKASLRGISSTATH